MGLLTDFLRNELNWSSPFTTEHRVPRKQIAIIDDDPDRAQLLKLGLTGETDNRNWDIRRHDGVFDLFQPGLWRPDIILLERDLWSHCLVEQYIPLIQEEHPQAKIVLIAPTIDAALAARVQSYGAFRSFERDSNEIAELGRFISSVLDAEMQPGTRLN